MIIFRMTAYGINGNMLAQRKCKSVPTFRQISQFANRIALAYGAHPRVMIEQIETK